MARRRRASTTTDHRRVRVQISALVGFSFGEARNESVSLTVSQQGFAEVAKEIEACFRRKGWKTTSLDDKRHRRRL